MTQSYNEKLFIGDVVLWEDGAGVDYCREIWTISSQTLVPGTVMTGTAASAAAYVDGTGVSATGIALEYAGTSATKVLVLARGPAIVRSSGLTGSDANAVADLAALGILVRTTVTSIVPE